MTIKELIKTLQDYVQDKPNLNDRTVLLEYDRVAIPLSTIIEIKDYSSSDLLLIPACGGIIAKEIT